MPKCAGQWALLILGALLGSQAAQPPVDVVVAHYNEDLSWVKPFMSPDVKFSIYSKGDVPLDQAVEILPNIGRESHTYLHHIVSNYDRLAPWTVFTQGAGPAWGYRSGDSSSGHLTDNITFSDYLNAFRHGKDAFFAITGATHIPKGVQSTRLGILTDKLKEMSNGLCPAGGPEGWSSWWFDANHPHHKAGDEMLAFYHRHVLQDGEATLKPVTLGFVQGARFGLSRARIQARPLEYYRALLQQVSKEVDPVQGYFMEAMWYDVFHPESPQHKSEVCEYSQLPVGYGLSLKDMYVDTARRLNLQGVVADVISPRSLSDAYSPDPTSAPTRAPTNPTRAPTSAPTSKPTSAPAPGTIVTGSVGTEVPDTTPYLTPGPTQDALKSAWATAIAALSPAKASDITVTFSAGRRLSQPLRRLGSPLVVDYEVFVAEGTAPQDVVTAMAGVTATEMQTEVVAAIQANPDVPANIKTEASQMQVKSVSAPSQAPVGGVVTTTTKAAPSGGGTVDSSARDLVAYSLAHLMGVAALVAIFSL